MEKRINTACVHKDKGCCPVSSRLITICLRVALLNTPMSDNTDSEIESHDQLQNVIDQTLNNDISLLCKETGMQKWARIFMKAGKAFADPSAK